MKRHISLFMSLIMVLTMIPTPLFAEDLITPENTVLLDESLDIMQDPASIEENIVMSEAPNTTDALDISNEDDLLVETFAGTIVASGACGKYLEWELDDAGTLTISGEGDMYDYTSETAPWYAHRDSIKSLVFNGELAWVTAGPFQNLPALTDIHLSASVYIVYLGAFSGCPSLTTFTVDADSDAYCAVDGVLMSANRHSLVCYPSAKADTSYTVLDGTREIVHSAFDNVSALTSISLPASICRLSSNTFSNCPNLSEIYYAGTETLWDIIAPNGLTTNADITFGNADMTGNCGTSATYTFNPNTGALTISGKGKIDSVDWPAEYVRTVFIGPDLTGFDERYSYYPLLQSVEVDPKNEYLTSIDGVLYECDDDGEPVNLIRYPAQKTDLSFTVPDTVTSIEFVAFDHCAYLQELFIHASVELIQTYSFNGESSLTAITVDAANQIFSSDNGVLLHNGALLHYPACKTDTAYSIPSSTTTLFSEQFGVCSSLTELHIPASIASLDPGVFQNLPNLESIVYEGTETAWNNLLYDDLSYYTDAVVTFENVTLVTGSCGDNATYTMDLDAGTLVISGSGAIYDYGYQSMPWYNKGIESIVIESGITYIGNQAFREMTTVKTLSLADTITEIGDFAFEGCEGITTLVLPSQLETINSYAFENCTALQTVYIPASVKSIDDLAFLYCSSLVAFSVDSGNSNYCAVDGVLMNKSQTILRSYPVGSANTSYTVPDGVTSIYACVFSGANNLTSIELPLSLKTISNNAFKDCENLASVSYAGTKALWAYVSVGSGNAPLLNADFTFSEVSIITGTCGEDATFTLDLDTGALVIFGTGEADSSNEWVDYVDLITSITVESGITAVWEDVFYDLLNLTALSLSETVTSLDYDVLNTYCQSLNSITVHADNPAYSTINSVLFSKDQEELLVYPAGKSDSSYTVPASVLKIELNAFCYNQSLTLLTLPAGLTIFGNRTIYRCDNLQNILLDSSNTNFICDSNVALIQDDVLLCYCPGSLQSSYTVPDGVTAIDMYAFCYASNLQAISLPLSLEEVEAGAFTGCKALETVRYPGTEAYWNYSVDVGTKGNTTFTKADYEFGTVDRITGTCGKNLSWFMDLTPGKLVVSGSGEMTKLKDSVSWPKEYIRSVVLKDGITTISVGAFSDCPLLTEVTIPASVTAIKGDAFYNSPIKTMYYKGSEPRWGLVSIEEGNSRLQMADHVYDSFLLVEWNSAHTVLTLSGEVEDCAYVMAAFYDLKGQLQLIKQFAAAEVSTGTSVSDSAVDLTQCTAKVLVLDENFAPVGVPYTPDTQKYDYVTAWFYATEHAYIDGGAFAGKDTLLFSDDKTVYIAGTDVISLKPWQLGQEYLLTVVPDTKEVLHAEESGGSAFATCIQYDLDCTASALVVAALKATLADDTIPCLIFDADCTGVPAEIDLDTLAEQAGIATTNRYRAIDKDGNGNIDYLLIQPYLYGMVDTTGTHRTYGEYMVLTDPSGEELLDPINEGSKWYISEITNLTYLPDEGDILKLTWNLEKDIYEVNTLDREAAEFESYSLTKGHSFDGARYFIAENGWVTDGQLSKNLLGEYFVIVTDGELLIYAEENGIVPLDAATLYADGEEIDEDAKNAVELLYALDIMLGDPSGNFNPENTVTRAEMAKIIYVILNYGQDDKAVNYTGANFFTDNQAGVWYEGYVNYCAATKLVFGQGDGTFGPNDPITTAEAARMLLCAIGYSADARGYVGTNWDKNVLADAAIIGLLDNYNQSTSAPAARQWLAVMIENALTKALTDKAITMGEKYFDLTEDSLIYRQVYTNPDASSGSTTLSCTIQAAKIIDFGDSANLSAFEDLGGNNNEYIVFTSLPVGGKLVYNWGATSQENVTVGTEYWLSNASGKKLMQKVTFVPSYSEAKVQKTISFGVKGYNGKDNSVSGTVNITVQYATASSKFIDIRNSTYADSVDFLHNESIMTGMTSTTFGPDGVLNRAQFVTYLWRSVGSPAVTDTTNPFTDVDSSGNYAYAYQAILWAVQNNLISGTGAGTFSPEGLVTREQALCLLHSYDVRYLGHPDVSSSTVDYTDYDSMGTWAQEAVRWADYKGVLTGTTIRPAETITRADFALWLHRTLTL